MASNATLVDPSGKKVVVTVGSPQASQLLSRGYKIYQGQAAPVNNIQSLLDQVTRGQQDFQNTMTARQGFADALKTRLAELDTTTKGVQGEVRGQQESQYNIPNTLREQLIAQGVTNPFERQKIIDQRLGVANSNISALQQILQNRGARTEDMLRSAQGTYEANLQGKQFSLENLKERLAQAQAEEAAKQAIVAKQQEEERNFQRQIYLAKLGASLKGSGGNGKEKSSKPTEWETTLGIKQSLSQDLNSLANRIVTSGNKRQGQMTREEAISDLVRAYPELSPQNISSTVYNAFPDGFRVNESTPKKQTIGMRLKSYLGF